MHICSSMYISLVLFLLAYSISADKLCSSSHNSNLKLFISSRRNQTRHWVSEVRFGHDRNEDSEGSWDIDIDQTVSKCEDEESVLFRVVMSAPMSNVSTVTPRAPGVWNIPITAGYEFIPGFGYYKLNPDLKNWKDAEDFCLQEGAHLLVINKEEEAKAMKLLWEKYPNSEKNWAYIGFHDSDSEGQYTTVTNETLESTGYVKWDPGNPNTGTAYNCGTFGRNANLAVFRCSVLLPFFCEMEL